MIWEAQAPSNIALIKYMGKQDAKRNLPDNASLSYTLDKLITTVILEPIESEQDRWEPLVSSSGDHPISLTQLAVDRFLQHLNLMKQQYEYTGSLIVRSKNNFPQGVGIASSASSFAALTKCAVLALSSLTDRQPLSDQAQAQLSRRGSGSSCRSFYRPWCLWEEDEVSVVTTPYPCLIHQVVLVDCEVKLVSSSEAHQRVRTSPHYAGRPARAQSRLINLLEALNTQAWDRMYEICYAEFMDMHRLFETASTPFSYMTTRCKDLLEAVATYWREKKDGPLVTMDAGATLHLLYRPDQDKLAQTFKETVLKKHVVL